MGRFYRAVRCQFVSSLVNMISVRAVSRTAWLRSCQYSRVTEGSDAFARREQAAENRAIAEHEHELLEKLKQKLREEKHEAADLVDKLQVMAKENAKEVEKGAASAYDKAKDLAADGYDKAKDLAGAAKDASGDKLHEANKALQAKVAELEKQLKESIKKKLD